MSDHRHRWCARACAGPSESRACRGAPGYRQAATLILFLQQLQVRSDFATEARVLGRRARKADESPQESPRASHHSASLVSSRLTRPAERCHQAACSASALTPDRVMV